MSRLRGLRLNMQTAPAVVFAAILAVEPFERVLQIHWKLTVLAPECAGTPEFTSKDVFTALAPEVPGANVMNK